MKREPDWRGFERQLRNFVRGRVDPQSVDDIVGSILLRLVKHEDALLTARNPAAFVQRTATNAVTDHYRRRSAERRALEQARTEIKALSEAGDMYEAEDRAQFEDEAAAALSRCLTPFIERLPERYAEALTLTEIEQLSRTEAAKRLGLSVSGLKSRVQRGRAMLKADLVRCCAVELDRRGHVIHYKVLEGPRLASCCKTC